MDWLFIGVLALVPAVILGMAAVEKRLVCDCTYPAKGVIISCKRKLGQSWGKTTMYYEHVVQYVFHGREYVTESQVRGTGAIRQGEAVDILISPDNPERQYCVRSLQSRLKTARIAAAVCAVVILLAVVFGMVKFV